MDLFVLLLLGLVAKVVLYFVARYLWELLRVSNLRDKPVLISGCDSGFGRLLALRLAQKGMRVFAGCLTEKGEDSIRKAAVGLLGHLETVPLDVTSDVSVDRALNTVQMHLEETDLWAVVNNAGVFAIYGPDDWLTLAEYRASLEVNLLGMIRMTQTFKPLLKKSKGRLVTMTSAAGRLSVSHTAPYTVAKFAAEAYMDCVRQELHLFGVTCSILEPGGYKTSLLDEDAFNARVDGIWKNLPPSVRQEYGEQYKETFKKTWNQTTEKYAGTRFEDVVDAYEHAITARYPRARYHCGWEALLFWIPLTYLPTNVVDWVIRKASQHSPFPLAIPAVLQKSH